VAVVVCVLWACAPAVDPAGDDPTPTSTAPAGVGGGRADFNGDGFNDLALRKTDPTGGNLADWGGGLGLVQALFGSADGFRTDAGRQWSAADFGHPVGPDAFGQALAHGDFDDDGFSDLVVGDPGATEDGFGGGEVRVLYGSPDGPSATRMRVWTLTSPGLDNTVVDGDGFGFALTVGSFGRSAHPDLAIGVPGRGGGGAVLVLFGGPDGLAAAGHQLWRQGHDGLGGTGDGFDDFGRSLAAGDFDGGGLDELVIGAPYDTVAGIEGVGSIYVLPGSADGLTAAGAQHWVVGQDGLRGRSGKPDGFGNAFAVGHFSDSGHLDLAVGKSGWNSPDGTGGAGAVHVIYGSPDGLTARGNQIWDEYVLGTRERAAEGDPPEDSPMFGSALVAADFGRGEQDDLVVGVPEAPTPGWASGAVQILYGTANGLTLEGSKQLSEVTRGIQGFDDDEALFGSALAVLGPAGSDEYPTLVVAAPWYGGKNDGDRFGMIHLIRGSANGLTGAGDQTLRAKQFPQRPVGEGFGRVLTS
jgi:hypothetical protein